MSASTEDTVLHCLPGKNMSSVDEDIKEYVNCSSFLFVLSCQINKSTETNFTQLQGTIYVHWIAVVAG